MLYTDDVEVGNLCIKYDTLGITGLKLDSTLDFVSRVKVNFVSNLRTCRHIFSHIDALKESYFVSP